MTTTAADISVGRLFWCRLIGELRRRGNGSRESGAFLLARPESRHLIQALYYDDLDPHCLDDGYINFNGAGYSGLTRSCQESGLRVLADVHTHPGSWTGQSQADRKHPMMPRTGHVALIVPHFARVNFLSLTGVGAFLYHGEGKWTDFHQHLRFHWL